MTSHERSWGSEELRAVALEILGAHADERAVDALRRGRLVLTHGAARWVGSTGPVQGHRVTLGLDAQSLGQLRAAPATVDSLCAALAAAIARRPGETLLELSLCWASGASTVSVGYRDAPRPPVSMREALVAYLDATGERSAARAIATARRITPEYASPSAAPASITLELDASDRDVLDEHGRARVAVTAAVRDLLGDPRTRLEVT